MNGATRHFLLAYLLVCLYAGGLAGQVQTFTVGPADPVENYLVAAIKVDSISVQLSELPEGCISGGDVVLPISTPQLTAARLDPLHVLLEWKTFDDDYTNRWILQRRLDSREGFTAIRELEAANFLRGDHADRNAYPGTSYYRLYGISPEGEEVHSSIVAVGNVRQTGRLVVYPNPATSAADVSLPGVRSSAKLTLVNALGRIVWRAAHPAGGSSNLRLPDLVPGAYMLRWEAADGEVATTRFVKM